MFLVKHPPTWHAENNRPEEQSWPSTRSHGVDVQLRRLQRYPGCGRLKNVFELAGIATYIRGGSCSVGRQKYI